MLMNTPCIRIAVFDLDSMLALGICSLLEKHQHLKAVPASLDDLAGTACNVAVIDPSQSKLNPVQIVAILRDHFGNPRLIGFSSDSTMSLARACMAAGFRGFLPKTAGVDGLQTAIMAVHGGALCMDPTFIEVFQGQPSPNAGQRLTELTDRETYVLKSVAQGKSMKEIGQELSLSAKTIETYKARGCGKLNLQGRRAIVQHAIRNGWVQ